MPTALDTRLPFKGKNLSGMKFGRLTVLSYAGRNKSNGGYWNCVCDCGKMVVTSGTRMKQGRSASCGCLKIEVCITAMRRGRTRHGFATAGDVDPTYNVWAGMRRRCENPKQEKFPIYGGRGIIVCERWKDFQNFVNDMGPRPPGLQIDRIDTNGNYEPGNCRWVTRKEQARNRRDNHFLEFNGKRATLVEWSEATGISYDNIKNRINNLGWSAEKALTVPVKTHAAITR